jgi:CRP/FNR family transcriptional regulator, cyclic AMP receptor protein
MSSQEMLDILRGVWFLHDIPDQDQNLGSIASISEVQEVPAGAVLFREGQTHPYIYLVIHGAVALEIWVSERTIKRVETVGDGELLGWSPALAQPAMTATGRALQPTRLIAIDAIQLGVLCEHNPRFGFEFMKRTAQALAHRLAALRLQLLDVYRDEIPTVPVGQEV